MGLNDMAEPKVAGPLPAAWRALLPNIPLMLGFVVIAAPTMVALGQQVWSREWGAHGPIVLATGAWLLSRRLPSLRAEAQPGNIGVTFLAALLSLAVYIPGRAFDMISLEAAGLYGFGLSLLHDRFGMPTLLRNWFPLFYLGLLLPIPGWLLDEVTAPLKLLVSTLSVSLLEPFGVPIAREGVTMTVGPYQLLVEDACSGLNSLIGLVAITLFYIYLLRDAGWRYCIFLVLLIIPVAIAANVIRIVVLILLTFYFGDAVGQGFLHVTAGLFLFAVSLLLMFMIDSAAARFIRALPKIWGR